MLDANGRDLDVVELRRMLKHWLSLHSVTIKLQRIGQSPPKEIVDKLYADQLDEAALAFWVRKLLLCRKVRAVIKQVLIANHGMEAKGFDQRLLKMAEKLKDASRFSRAEMVIPSPEEQQRALAPPTGLTR